MKRESLVIIPAKYQYELGFSAPLSYMLSPVKDYVRGVFGFELTKELVKNFDFFIIEINWFLVLHEVNLIVKFIRKHNPKAKILFGGLFSQLHYDNIFKTIDVDFFIKGDNEEPIRLFIEGKDYKKIPNLISPYFQNEQNYIFQQKEFDYIEYNIDWFTNYFKYLKLYKNSSSTVNYTYILPMIITSKICSVAHKGCEYCLGSKRKLLHSIYKRKPVELTNKQLIRVLKNFKYKELSIIVLNKMEYDLRNYYFDLIVNNFEVDGPVDKTSLEKIVYSFKKIACLLPINKTGIMSDNLDLKHYDEIFSLTSKNINIVFVTYEKYQSKYYGVNNLVYNLDGGFKPFYANFNYYYNFNNAIKESKLYYNSENTNLKFTNSSFKWQNEFKEVI